MTYSACDFMDSITDALDVDTSHIEEDDAVSEIADLAIAKIDALKKPIASLEAHMAEAEEKAWDSLSRYKFQMFGYWAAIWVHLNKISGARKRNPFSSIVVHAKNKPGGYKA